MILEKNITIAKFMGAITQCGLSFPIRDNEIWLPMHGIVKKDTISIGKGRITQYHNSWDWLMPVIRKLFKHNVTYVVSEEAVKNALPYAPIEEVHQLVYEWIEKINNNEGLIK